LLELSLPPKLQMKLQSICLRKQLSLFSSAAGDMVSWHSPTHGMALQEKQHRQQQTIFFRPQACLNC
jgi:hypothetical protein